MLKPSEMFIRIFKLFIRYSLQGFMLLKFHNSNRDFSVFVCGEWFGDRTNDNVSYLANYIAQNHDAIKLYWVSADPEKVTNLHDRITLLKKDSFESLPIFHKAGVVLMGQSFKDFSSKGYNYFSGALTINLWHGLPWKKIGPPSRPTGLKWLWKNLIVRKLFQAEYIACSSSHHAEVMGAAFNVKTENVIMVGQPRSEVFHDKSNARNISDQMRTALGFSKYDTLVAYLPTFRANAGPFDLEGALTPKKAEFDLAAIRFITKRHFVDREKCQSFSRDPSFCVDVSDFDTQEILAAADILITDYSGVFFDFLLLDRPIIHLLVDYDDYVQRDRGLYFDVQTIRSGHVVRDEKLLSSTILTVASYDTDSELRNYKRSIFQDYETANSAQKITDFILSQIKSRRNG